MPTQIDEASDYDFIIHLLYERSRIRLHDGKHQLVQRISQFLVPNGYLLTGHSESLNGLNIPLRCLKPSIYQKA